MPSSVTSGDPARCTSRNRGSPARPRARRWSRPGTRRAPPARATPCGPESQAAVGDLVIPRSSTATAGGRCARWRHRWFATVHARQAFQLRATPNMRKARSSTSIGVSSRSAGNCGNTDSARSPRACSSRRGLEGRASSRTRESRGRPGSDTRAPTATPGFASGQRLEPVVGGDSALGPQPAKPRQSSAKWPMATSSLNAPSAPSTSRLGRWTRCANPSEVMP